MKIELTNEQRKNLVIFLTRTSLSGSEVPAYLEIVKSLNEPMLEKISGKKKEQE